MKTPHQDIILDYSSQDYDTEAMRIDDSNGNFDPSNAEDYEHSRIILASIQNGQHEQAREQCDKWGYRYETMKALVH